jgi:hypothetical protein
MNPDERIERLLADAQSPRVVEGSHRAALQRDLLLQERKEPSTMFTRKRVLVACAVAIGVIAAGWAAQKAWQTFVVYESGPEIIEETVNPDGSMTVKAVARKVGVTSNDPNFTQVDADARWEEMVELMKRGEYEFVETRQTDEGLTIYVYKMVLSDGTVEHYGGNEPIEKFVESLK